MKLIYITPENNEKEWFVKEIEAGKRYGLVDECGKDFAITVDVKKDRVYRIESFNGFVINGNGVLAVAMLAGIPTSVGVVVGHSPRVL